MLGRVVEKTLNGRRLNPGGRSLSMSQRTRENVAILLFFPSLAFLILKGWENFCAAGYVGRAWLYVIIPAVLMTVAIIVWPQKITPPDES